MTVSLDPSIKLYFIIPGVVMA